MKEAAIAEYIRDNERVAIGGGQSRGGGNFTPVQSGIVHYAPDELLITVKAGTAMAELEETLHKKDQMLAQEPMDHSGILGTNGVSTIGGAIGMNADGPRRLRYGALREALLGVRFIDGKGETIRAGGVVMKNVTGLDLTKFFAGSRGRLGIALDANFKLLPLPKETRHLSFEIDLECFQNRALPLLRQPLEITGMIWHENRLYIRQEGAQLAPLTHRLENAFGQGRKDDKELWVELRDWAPMNSHQEIWRIYTRPTQAADTVRALGRDAMILCGGGQVLCGAGEERIKAALQPQQYAICEKGPKRHQRLLELSPKITALNTELRAVFDPEQKFEA